MLDVRSCQPYLALRLICEVTEECQIAPEIAKEWADDWAKVVCESDIYETLGRELGITRAVAKTEWFKLLFGPNYMTSRTKILFEDWFPAMAAVFHRMKWGDHRRLATRLQLYESHVILERIAPRIAKLGIPALTIHDSFIVGRTELEEVCAIMAVELKNVAGWPPVIAYDGFCWNLEPVGPDRASCPTALYAER